MDKIISKEQFWNRLISSCEENWASLDTIDEILSEMPSIDNEIINDAHNEGYDVGYWAGRRDYEPRWIPVTERLPELYTDVLLSVRQGYAFGEPDNWCVVGGLIDKADITWATNYGFHDLLYSNGKKHTVWVSAWMPLPAPYKGGEEE